MGEKEREEHLLSMEDVANLCDAPEFVDHYRRSLDLVGLWRSEEILFSRLLDPADKILDVGCGAGRVAFGLWELGYRSVEGLDISPRMIHVAKTHAKKTGQFVTFRTGDATSLLYPEKKFDAVLCPFGGLMQIPGRGNRRTALKEILRVTRPGGVFIFTAHDREMDEYREFWRKMAARRSSTPGLEFGDIYEEGPHGIVFVHIPDRQEVREDLEETGWEGAQDILREEIAEEDETVEDLSDPCRFWIARRPANETGKAPGGSNGSQPNQFKQGKTLPP